MEVQLGETKTRRPGGVRLGAGRLMTYKASHDLPEHALKEELAKLDARKDRMEHFYKKEAEITEAILVEILDSLGNYVNLDTRRSVHESLQREVMRTLASTKKAEPVIDEPDDNNDPDSTKAESHVAKKIKAAKKRKAQKMQALRPRKQRPSYKALIESEKRDKHRVNHRSFISLLEFYGQEQDADRINMWMNFLYPTTREHSASLFGMKKRLERYKNRLLMDSDPKDNGIDWFENESKVVSRYPEAVKLRPEKRKNFFLPPLNYSGNLTTIKSEDSSSQGSKEPRREESRESRRSFKKEPISASEFVFGTRPRSQKSNISQLSDPIDVVLEAQESENQEESKVFITAVPKGILLTAAAAEDKTEEEKAKPVKKVSIYAPADMSDHEDGLSSKDGESRDEADKRRRSEYDLSTLEKRKKSLTTKVDEKRIERLDYLKSEVAKVSRLQQEGRENEIDYQHYFERRKSLALLLDEDESYGYNDEDFKKTWNDVQNCKYIRGYEPPEMRGTTEESLSEFVFWKGEFDREESFVGRRKEAKKTEEEEAKEHVEEPPRPRRKSLADIGRRLSLADVGRRPSVTLLETKKDSEPKKQLK